MFSANSPAFWIAISITILAAIDLGLLYRERKTLPVRRAAARTASWTMVGILFAGVMYHWGGSTRGHEFLVGFAVEKVLLVGNVFVIASIAAAFGLRGDREHRVLLWGVLGAWAIRGPIIAASAAFFHSHPFVAYLLGGVALVVGVVLLKTRRGFSDVATRAARGLLGRRLPADFEEGILPTGGWQRSSVAPLVALVVVAEVALANLVFAVAAVPTIHAITEDTLIIWASNGVALLGLGPLYFLVSNALLRRVHFLEFGLASLLFVVGAKLLLGGLLPISLGATVFVAFSAIGLSVAGSFAQPLVPPPFPVDEPPGGR